MKSMLTRLAASATISILMLGGIFAGAPAQAGGTTHASCSNVFVQVICIGTINNNPITITIGDINILNGNQINILNVQATRTSPNATRRELRRAEAAGVWDVPRRLASRPWSGRRRAQGCQVYPTS